MAPSGWAGRGMGDNGTWLIGVFSVAWFGTVVVPLAAIVAFSFLRSKGLEVTPEPSFRAYETLFSGAGAPVLLRTLRICAIVTLVELLLAFPFALWLAKSLRSRTLKLGLFLALLIPFFLAPVARVFAWRSILGTEGMVNTILVGTGITDGPVSWLLFSEFAIYLGLISQYFPNMVWPLYLSILLIDDDYLQASADLGGNRLQTLLFITIPLSAPGIVAGIVFTFVPMLGEAAVPAVLGGNNSLMLSSLVDSYVVSQNYAGAAAMAALVIAALLLLLGAFALLIRPSGGAGAFASLRR